MAKNKQSPEVNQPIWFDGKSINEALFCDGFLSRHKIIYTNGAFFTPDGRVTDELPLRGEIFEELKCCAVSNIPRKISNIVELMKLAALVAACGKYNLEHCNTITNSAGRRVWGFMGIEAVARPHINEFTDASQCTYVPEGWRD